MAEENNEIEHLKELLNEVIEFANNLHSVLAAVVEDLRGHADTPAIDTLFEDSAP